MSLFGNSYEDAVYSNSHVKAEEKEWYEIPYNTAYVVDCSNLKYDEVMNLFTKLVNGEGAVDDEDIIVDEDAEEITYFEIIGNFSFSQTCYIDDKLNRFNVKYSVK